MIQQSLITFLSKITALNGPQALFSKNNAYFFNLADSDFGYILSLIKSHLTRNSEPEEFFSLAKKSFLWISLALADEDELSLQDPFSLIDGLFNQGVPGQPLFLQVDKKPSAALVRLLEKLNFVEITCSAKSFKLADFLKEILVLSSLSLDSKKLQATNMFFDIKFLTLDKLCNFVQMLPFLSASNFLQYKNQYLQHLSKEDLLFSLPKLLYQKKKDLFFYNWRIIKNDYPVQFWTVFFMNNLWKSLQSEGPSKDFFAKRLLFENLYQVDFLSKKQSRLLSLERAFFNYF